jgi:peptidyl-prolyl cis-trans isomerase B (cyclophilin B)
MNRFHSLAIIALFSGLLAGCEPTADNKEASTPPPTTTTETGNSSTTGSTAPDSSYDSSVADSQLSQKGEPAQETPEGTISVAKRAPKNGEEVAVLETEMGKIVLMFFPDKAPKHVENFKKLVKSGFYNGTKFHRTIPGFMIQGGDPNTKSSDRGSWGMGGPDHSVKAEFNDIHHAIGVLSMARSQDPDSAGSQFFIMVGDAPFLDKQYTAFGKVVKGQEVAGKIVSQPAEGELAVNPVAIKKATLAKWPVK